jgi:hypothetical protein
MNAPTARVSGLSARLPRFGLRSLLLAVVIVAVLVQVVPLVWRRYVAYRHAREYATMQAAKKWPISSRESFAIDQGRGIPDDYVILVRRGDLFGCFIPRNQFKKGESVEIEWYFRGDGVGYFNSDDPNVHSGRSFVGPYIPGIGQSLAIKFGPFEIPWSGNERGWGFIYYDYNPPDRAAADILRISATDVKTLEYLDARDPKWIYKAYPGDQGLAGDQSSRNGATPAQTQASNP